MQIWSTVAPLVGAWIETSADFYLVALRVERVNWNAMPIHNLEGIIVANLIGVACLMCADGLMKIK